MNARVLAVRKIGTAILVAVLLGAIAGCATPAFDEMAWDRWLKWLPSAPPTSGPLSILQAYRESRVSAGASPAEVHHEVAAITRLLRTRTDGWRGMFNSIYASSNPEFNTQPNVLLVKTVEGRQPGRALDVGIGQGRNSVFLALKGWEVTGFDVSEEGIKASNRNAERAGVKIRAVQQSNEQFPFGTENWDLIVVTYEPVPLTDSRYVNQLRTALRPNGLIVIESIASNTNSPSRSPVDVDPQLLRRAFETAGFKILHYEDVVGQGDWSPAKLRLGRLVAQK